MKGISVSAPRFEHHHSGLGVSTPTPRISWSFSQANGEIKWWQQESYDLEIRFFDEEESEMFSVSSSESICVPWAARPLRSREAATVRVRSYGTDEALRMQFAEPEATEWSEWANVEAALFQDFDWKANWIAAPKQEKNEDGSLRPIRLFKHFELSQSKKIKRVRLYITSRGCYEAQINGQEVGNQHMAPGWQSYKHRLHYQIFDVKDLVSLSSSNVIDVNIGPGWYASALAWAGGRRCCFGDELSLLAQLMIDFEGERDPFIITSGSSWYSAPSRLTSSELYNGETFDQSLGQNLTNTPSVPARVVPPPPSKLISPDIPPVRVTETLRPLKIFTSPTGRGLVDFGQNLVGRLRIASLQKPPGTTVSFSHAEVLENGELGRRPLRNAKATDTIVCDGTELRDWAPKFTFHGFRYVEVIGWTPRDTTCPLTMDSLVAEVLHTDMRRTGHFECSHPMINKLHENATWSMRGNFVSIPTDCPQRDERLGWTGDIQVFAPSANFLYDTMGMLSSWLEDLAAEQLSDEHAGVPPFVVPDVISKFHEGDGGFWPKLPNAVWDDVCVLLPWSLYRSSGDKAVLKRQFESMKIWLARGVRRGSDGLWDESVCQLGDWLDPIAPPSEPGNGRTDGGLVADAYLVFVTRRVMEVCHILERQEEELRYRKEYFYLSRQFRAKYITKTGLIVGDTQTALALGIMFDLFDSKPQMKVAGDRLARSVYIQQFRVATGFAGTPIILQALTKVDHYQLAYRMLLEKRCPSWMYAVSMGATTIWERWDSMLPDGNINPGEMTSFNHYALGSVVNWLHESVGGISPLKPGWKEILVHPVPGGGMTNAKVCYDGPYGRIECAWKLESDTAFELDLIVPPNSKAYIVMPGRELIDVDTEGQGVWAGSGHHKFTSKVEKQPWPPEAIMPPFWPQPQPTCA